MSSPGSIRPRRKLFAETFAQVRANFPRDVLPSYSAAVAPDLQLMDENDALNCGIENHRQAARQNNYKASRF